MKRLLTLAAVAAAMLTAQAQTEDPYKAQFDVLDAQAEHIMQQYKALNIKPGDTPSEEAKAKMVELVKQLDAINDEEMKLVRKLIKENHDNTIPAKYIKDAMYNFSYEELKEILDPTAGYYNSPELDTPKRLLAGYEKRKPGIQFHDLDMQDTDDRFAQLSQWVGHGNYVLVDFWASWCGPCRQEMPNVVANYEKYKSKGFNVVGVSFDQKKDAWVAAIQKLGMKWPQISDLKGWKCAAAEAYGVSSIPSNVLVDPTGKIVAMDLRGEKLSEALNAIYGE